MKGWEILVHSVRLVFTNLDAALKISLLPYALSGLAMVLLGLPGLRAMMDGTPEAMIAIGTAGVFNFMIYGLVSGIVALWIAVSWHRYVLLEEYPTGWFPTFHGGPILSYFFRSILVVLAVIAVTTLATLLLGLSIGLLGSAGVALTGLLSGAVATYTFYRLCPILPSAAVGKPMPFGQAWEATKDTGGAILVLVILVLVASAIIQLPNTLGAPDSLFGIVYSLIINWLSTLIGVSVLTTFYGHFIEGRDID